MSKRVFIDMDDVLIDLDGFEHFNLNKPVERAAEAIKEIQELTRCTPWIVLSVAHNDPVPAPVRLVWIDKHFPELIERTVSSNIMETVADENDMLISHKDYLGFPGMFIDFSEPDCCWNMIMSCIEMAVEVELP